MASVRQQAAENPDEFPEQVRHRPRGLRAEDATTRELVEAGLAASSWPFHWYQWGDGVAFDPYGRWSDAPRFEKQVEFLEDESKFKAFIGGVGSGKTLVGAAESIRFLMENPGSTGIIAAPTYKMLSSSTERTFRELLHPLAIHRQNKTEGVLELTNGSTVFFRSTDRPDLIRGIDASFVFFDEAAQSTRDAWNVLVGRLRQVGFPHRAWVTTTPRGENWVHELFVGDDSPEQYGWVQVSARDNPHLNEEFIRALEDTYAGRFASQEIEGEFVGMKGRVYPEFVERRHVIDLELLEQDSYGSLWLDKTHDRRFRAERTMFCVDWGWQNPVVCLAVLVDSDERMIVAREKYSSHLLAEEMGREVWEEWVPETGKGIMVCDPSEPDEIDKMARIGFNAQGGNNEVLTGIQEVTSRLAPESEEERKRKDPSELPMPRLLVSSECENTIKEFRMYHYPDEDGEAKSEKPVEEHDHAMDALRYGAMELHRGPGIQRLDNSDLDLVI